MNRTAFKGARHDRPRGRPFWRCFIAGALTLSMLLSSGCTTYLLWDSDFLANRKRPASDPRFTLLHDEIQRDYVVHYLEKDESSGKVRHRIYYLLANDLATVGQQKPRFLNALPDGPLVEIPVYLSHEPPNNVGERTSTYVVMEDNRRQFTVFFSDGSTYAGHLPEYSGKLRRTGQVLLTPITVAIDIALIAAVSYALLQTSSSNLSWD